MARALIVEDDADARTAVVRCAESAGFDVTSVADRASAVAELISGGFDVLMIDMFLPDGTAFDVLFEGQAAQGDAHVILMTGDDNAATAFSADSFRSMRFLEKPIDFDALDSILREIRAASTSGSGRSGPHGVERLIGSSPAMERVRDLIRRVGPSDFSVYIQGESGSGKEVVARAIHETSPRSSMPFVALNCGAIPETLIDSELFGHEKGAFTGADDRKIGVFEQADRGTLFLDEIAEMPVELQVRLLRALEQRVIRRVGGKKDVKLDVRVVSATNRDFETAIQEGAFREDLFYRLCVMPITVAPLRQRPTDITELAEHFLRECADAATRELEFSSAALDALRRHPLPGNVRQLRNVVQRASLLADRVIEPEHLELDSIPAATPDDAPADGVQLDVRVGQSIASAERRLIEATLKHEGGDKKAAAESLGVSLRTLYNRLREYAESERHESES